MMGPISDEKIFKDRPWFSFRKTDFQESLRLSIDLDVETTSMWKFFYCFW